jgi:hypothetical protein
MNAFDTKRALQRISDAHSEIDHLLRAPGEYIRRSDLEPLADQIAHSLRMLLGVQGDLP